MYGFYKFTEILKKHAARFFKHPGFPKILIGNLILNKKKRICLNLKLLWKNIFKR